MKQVILIAFAMWAFVCKAQNLTQNPNLSSGWTGWDQFGCSPEVGGVYPYTGSPYWFESHYGGPSATNLVAQLGGGLCLTQELCVLKGVTYRIKFKGARRCESDNPDLPDTLSLILRVMGSTSFVMYAEQVYDYTNTTWVWHNESIDVTIPANANDNKVYFILAGYNITTEFGPIVDDITFEPVPTIAVNGPAVAAVNTNTNWGVDNAPAAGVTYNWSFPGATPSTSSLANPTNVQWNSTGTKTVSCILNNGSCDVAAITQNISITSALPVDIIAFNAAEKNSLVELNWTTANEVNSDYFTVYKSKDGVSFAEIGKVNATGIQSGSSYRFTDPAPGTGTIYYQLKQTDKNGSNKLTGIIKLKMGNADINATLYPTVVTAGTLNYVIQVPHSATLYATISDISGRKLMNTTNKFENGTTIKTVDVSRLASGIYLLTVTDTNGDFKKTMTFTKN